MKLEQEVNQYIDAIRSNHKQDIVQKILKLAKETSEIKYRDYTDLSEQPKVVMNVLAFASQGHQWETLQQYRDTIKSAWDQLNKCYEDAYDPDIGDIRLDNIQEHISDLNDYIPGLLKNLPQAITAARTRFSPSIFPVLEVFDKYLGNKLLRGTAWNYKISFLSGLGEVKGEFDTVENGTYDPLSELKAIFEKGLQVVEKQGGFLDSILTDNEYHQRILKHHLRISINDEDITLSSKPNDAQMVYAIKKVVH
ncbi:MAG TPA: hypothetical protein VJK51_05095 [Candidatus Nanoarchaeia archaeon]|nr:hypothetical protein [Candidatus Nanoarchaeia archaeon]